MYLAMLFSLFYGYFSSCQTDGDSVEALRQNINAVYHFSESKNQATYAQYTYDDDLFIAHLQLGLLPKMSVKKILDQELIPYRYSSCC